MDQRTQNVLEQVLPPVPAFTPWMPIVPNTSYFLILKSESDCQKLAFLTLGQQLGLDINPFWVKNQWSLVEKRRVNCSSNQGKSSSEHVADGKTPWTFCPNYQFISRSDGMRQDLSFLRKAKELAGESGEENSGIISRVICERVNGEGSLALNTASHLQGRFQICFLETHVISGSLARCFLGKRKLWFLRDQGLVQNLVVHPSESFVIFHFDWNILRGLRWGFLCSFWNSWSVKWGSFQGDLDKLDFQGQPEYVWNFTSF